MWSCFYRNTSCEEAAETLFISVRTMASFRRYLLSAPKRGQGSEVSRESNDNRDNHFAKCCTSLAVLLVRPWLYSLYVLSCTTCMSLAVLLVRS